MTFIAGYVPVLARDFSGEKIAWVHKSSANPEGVGHGGVYRDDPRRGIPFVLCLALALAYSNNPRRGIPRLLHSLALVLAEQVMGRPQGFGAAV